jgi:hypothetical protein
LSMKHIYENKILDTNKIVINATEGGLHINGTKNMSLQDVITKYCYNEFEAKEKNIIKNNTDFDNFKFIIKKVINDFEEIENDCDGILRGESCEIRINRLKYNQGLISLFEDMSTDLVLHMMKQNVIEKKYGQETIDKYYSNIKDAAKFYKEIFKQLT